MNTKKQAKRQITTEELLDYLKGKKTEEQLDYLKGKKQVKKQTKTDKVLAHLKSGKTITSMDAFRMFRLTRLSGIIFQLNRTKNAKIKCVMVQGKDTRFGVYYIGKKLKV